MTSWVMVSSWLILRTRVICGNSLVKQRLALGWAGGGPPNGDANRAALLRVDCNLHGHALCCLTDRDVRLLSGVRREGRLARGSPW
jgi:hypothetical protein